MGAKRNASIILRRFKGKSMTVFGLHFSVRKMRLKEAMI